MRKEQCSKIIEDVCGSNGRLRLLIEVMGLISKCGTKLKYWNINSFKNVRKCLAEANLKLMRIQEKHPTDLNTTDLNGA